MNDCDHSRLRTSLSDGSRICLLCGQEWALTDSGYVEVMEWVEEDG